MPTGGIRTRNPSKGAAANPGPLGPPSYTVISDRIVHDAQAFNKQHATQSFVKADSCLTRSVIPYRFVVVLRTAGHGTLLQVK